MRFWDFLVDCFSGLIFYVMVCLEESVRSFNNQGLCSCDHYLQKIVQIICVLQRVLCNMYLYGIFIVDGALHT